MKKRDFGIMPDGMAVHQYTLADGGLECDIIPYGGALRSLRVPGRDGQAVDILLGFDRLEDYRTQDKYMGALIGRYANRIGGASFDLGGVHYPLAQNDGKNHLHGGTVGFDKQVWKVEEAGDDRLTLSLTSPDGQEGYPGTLAARVTYQLAGNSLTIDYRAKSDRDTLCNLTSHGYFNLSGHAGGSVLDHEVQLFADFYTPIDPCSIPTGELAPVEGTPMDLRQPVPIGAHINEDHPQLKYAGGYDHNWVIRGERGTLRPAARVTCPDTGIVLEVSTTQPGLQFYTGNFLDGCPAGKGGVPYGRQQGFCLEAQTYPDSPNQPGFPSAVLRAGEEYRQRTVYRMDRR